jgi:Tol biopolymer transport system component
MTMLSCDKLNVSWHEGVLCCLVVSILLGLHRVSYRRGWTVGGFTALSLVGLSGFLLRPCPASQLDAIALHSSVSPTPRAAALPVDYGVLAYVQAGSVYIHELPQGMPMRITRQDEAENVRWSPKGKWLLFQQQSGDSKHSWQRSMVVRRDGTGLRKICQSESAAWVGRDDELAFQEGGAIWLARAPDFQRQQLARMPKEIRNHSVSFEVSPDKKQIAFKRWWINWNREGTDFNQGSGVLWVENTDGTHRRKLYDAHGRLEDLPILGGWSPDSHHVFMGTWVYHAGSGNLDGTPLFVFDIQTGKRRSLAPNYVMKHFDWYVYSADAHKIVVVDGGARWGLNAKTLLVVDSRTWKRHRITSPSVDSVFPAWSPDGGRLAFIENNAFRSGSGDWDARYYNNRLCVMEADGTQKKRLTGKDGYSDWDPMWCGDGRHILFCRLGKDNHMAFWLICDDGQELRRFANDLEFSGDDHWRYDFWTPKRAWDHR